MLAKGPCADGVEGGSMLLLLIESEVQNAFVYDLDDPGNENDRASSRHAHWAELWQMLT